MSASLDEVASLLEIRCRYPDQLAEAPTNDRPTRQMGEADIGLTTEFSEQRMDVAGNDVAAVT